LGRQHAVENFLPYELIGTVSEFMTFFQKDIWYHNDPQLFDTLRHITCVHGNKKLITDYYNELYQIYPMIIPKCMSILKNDINSLYDNQYTNIKKNITGLLIELYQNYIFQIIHIGIQQEIMMIFINHYVFLLTLDFIHTQHTNASGMKIL
jgi:hypothetical protein